MDVAALSCTRQFNAASKSKLVNSCQLEIRRTETIVSPISTSSLFIHEIQVATMGEEKEGWRRRSSDSQVKDGNVKSMVGNCSEDQNG